MSELSRRGFLKSGAAGAALAALPGLAGARQGDPAYAGFNMGVQTYSLRRFGLDEVLKFLTEDFGVRYAQFFNGKQMPLTDDPARLATYRKKLKDASVRIMSYGVQRYTKDHEANRKNFEFAKAMGFDVCVANPSPDSFESIDALCKEYGMKIAIHNHGPEDKTWGRLDQLLKGIEKYPEHIGACVDTGHTLRIGEDPVKSIKELGPRVHDVHLKDASGPKSYNIVGEGNLKVLETFRALREVKFKGIVALEYELNPAFPIDDMKKCFAAAREACAKL